MPKLIQVITPPLDGTEFVVVWIECGAIYTNRYKIVDGVIFFFDLDNYRYEKEYDTPCSWDDDIDAKFFVMGE